MVGVWILIMAKDGLDRLAFFETPVFFLLPDGDRVAPRVRSGGSG
jgi:hypothetical protein